MSQPLRVLVAEDEPMNLRRLVRLLEECGCEVAATFGNGPEVEEWLAAGHTVDALFLDIQMPGLDGLTAGSILKGDPATSGLKIIALTSFAMQGDEQKFLKAGFDGYLSKPISTRELPVLVQQWLEEKQP